MGRRKQKAMKIIEPSYTILRPCALDARRPEVFGDLDEKTKGESK